MELEWYTSEVREYIVNNPEADPHRFMLNPPVALKSISSLVADQLISRKKARKKLPEWYANPDLILPKATSVEQASSESTALYKASFFGGNCLIDLTGGMGIDTWALSKGFNETTYIERDQNLAALFQHNSRLLNPAIKVIHTSAEEFLQGRSSPASFFLDPLRRNEKERFFRLEDCEPNLHALMPQLEMADQVLIKLSPLVDIHSLLQTIPRLHEVHVVSVKNECKEVLVWIRKETTQAPEIVAVNLETDQPEYRFLWPEERDSVSPIGATENYIYEPNSSILKSGAFKKIGNDFGLTKLHLNTHLYTSVTQKESFPGHIFRVIDHDIHKKKWKKLGVSNINVITRNYPKSTSEFKKEWKVNDGGNQFLIAIRNHLNQPQVLLAERITSAPQS